MLKSKTAYNIKAPLLHVSYAVNALLRSIQNYGYEITFMTVICINDIIAYEPRCFGYSFLLFLEMAKYNLYINKHLSYFYKS